jgi:glycosyltransferase involved in cell wall biosynthesis
MAKVAEIIRFYSLDGIMDFINKGGEYPLHHVWCYDKIKEKGIHVDCIEYNNKSRLNRIGEKMQIFNLQQQINLLKKSKEYDLVYVPFVADAFLLALLKTLGLYKKPILALALDTHIPFKKSYVKRLKQKLLRSVYNHGIDSVLYFNETMYHKSNEYGPLGKNSSFTEWGADLDFFTSFVERQTQPPSLDFIYSTGGTGRDFKTLIKAFENIDFNLKITTKRSEEYNMYIPPNVIIDDSVVPGLHSVGIIRKEYYNSLAVAIPLRNTGQLWPVGITVIMEALAMSKPIISTYNSMYPFNLEKEKVGLYVDYNDVSGWREAARYLINNPDEAREMGERGRYLSEKKYNYEVFSDEVINQIKKYIFVKKKEVAKKANVPAHV